MKNSTARTISALAATFAIALPLTITQAVAQSAVSGTVSAIRSAVNDRPIIGIIGSGDPAALGGIAIVGTAPSATAVPALSIGDDSTARIGDINLKSHSSRSNTRSENPEVEITLKCKDSVTGAETVALSNATGVCIGGIRIEMLRFNGTPVSPTTVASSPGGNVSVGDNYVVGATLKMSLSPQIRPRAALSLQMMSVLGRRGHKVAGAHDGLVITFILDRH